MKKIFAVGSYTTPDKAEIARIAVDDEADTITALEPVRGIGNPIYFAIDKARGRLYAAQTTAPDADRMTCGALASYAFDEGSLALTPLDLLPLPFSVPCHVSLSRSGDHLLFAEYSFAHAGAVPVGRDGKFGKPCIVHHEGHGPNAKRQESAHCHCIVPSPDADGVFVCDLGTDTVNNYGLAGDGTLTPRHDFDFHCKPGLGPRHMTFNATGDRAYLIYELGCAVQSFSYAGGRLTPLQEPLSTLPPGFGGESKCAAIRISPCGKWLLASNRGHDSIAAFRILDDGTLDGNPTISSLTGTFPRDFVFVSDTCAIVGHKLSDNIGLYRFNPADGSLTRMNATYAMPRPLAFIS